MKFGLDKIFMPKKPKKETSEENLEKEKERLEQEKMKHDPLLKFIKERMGLDPNDVNLHYEFVAKKEIDPTDPDKIKFIKKEVKNYHDFLASRSAMNKEQKEELDIGYRDLRGHWDSPAVFAHQDFQKRLKDKNDPLNQYRDEFNKLISAALKGELEDEYDSAVKRGEIAAEGQKENDQAKTETGSETGAKAVSEDITLKRPEVFLKKTIEESFREKFNLIPEDLATIEGFNDLSEGQQRLVLENLEQIALGRIEEEAISKYKKEVGESSWRGKLWRGISKKYQIAEKEKLSEREIMLGGMEKHGEVLKQLVKGLKNFGPEVEIKDGQIEIKYVSGMSPENREVADEFNAAATEYSKIPYEWSLETAGRSERKKYEAAKEKYEAAKESILSLKQQEIGDKEALLYLNNIDGKVNLSRFLSAHPKAEKQLSEIKDKKALKRILGDIVTERGIYFAAGFGSRTAAMGVIGLAGVPFAAFLTGGYMGRVRAKQTLKENEMQSRRGAGKNEQQQLDLKEINRELNELYQGLVKTESLKELQAMERLIKDKQSQREKLLATKKFTKIEEANAKIEKLINLLMNVNIRDEKAAVYKKSLILALEITENKLDKGLIDFGNQSEQRMAQQYNLILNISQGRAFLAEDRMQYVMEKMYVGDGYARYDERYDRAVAERDARSKKAREWFLNKQMVKGAVLGAGFALAGQLTRQAAGEVYDLVKGGSKIDLSQSPVKLGGGLKKWFNWDKPEKFVDNIKKMFSWGEQAKEPVTGKPVTGKLSDRDTDFIPGKLKGPAGEQYEEIKKPGDETILESIKEKLSKLPAEEPEPVREEGLTPPADKAVPPPDEETLTGKPKVIPPTPKEEVLAKATAEPVVPDNWAKIHELATIKKGEGIEHTLIRQLENDPKGMGCPPETIAEGPKAVHLWAGKQAHLIAEDQGFFETDEDGKITETWVKYDPKKPAEFVLTRDADGNYFVTDIDGKTYQHERVLEAMDNNEQPMEEGKTQTGGDKEPIDFEKVKNPDSPEFYEQQSRLESTEITPEQRQVEINNSIEAIDQRMEKRLEQMEQLEQSDTTPEETDSLRAQQHEDNEYKKFLEKAVERKAYQDPLTVKDLLPPKFIDQGHFKDIMLSHKYGDLDGDERRLIDKLFDKYIGHSFKNFKSLPSDMREQYLNKLAEQAGQSVKKVMDLPEVELPQRAFFWRNAGEIKWLQDIWKKFGAK